MQMCRDLSRGITKPPTRRPMQASITKLCLVCFETKCDCGQKRRKAAQKTKGLPKLRGLPSPTTLQITPSTPHRLRKQLVYCIEELRLRWSWVALIPARIGVNATVDAAALSLCQAHQYHALGRFHGPSLDLALRSYSRTLNMLRKAVATPSTALLDSTLASVALVAKFETIIKHCPGTKAENVFSHWTGIEAILCARTGRQHCSELTRSIIYNMYDCMFGVPVSLGRPSPFEGGPCPDVKPAAVEILPQDNQMLQQSSLYISIFSPRLIQYTRQIREGKTDPEHMKHTVELLNHLLQARNDEAESSLLHRVRVIKNEDSDDSITGPFAFDFDSLIQYRAAILYWSFHLVVINVYVVLSSLVPADLLEQLPGADVIRHQTRWMVNLIMSWAYARRQGSFAQTDAAQGSLVLWQALKERESFKGKSKEAWRRWLLPKMMLPLTGWTSGKVERVEEMDVASEMLAGGPLEGFMRSTAVKQ
ncbi:hypothetical protein EJ03DRAFT_118609 [Teratosphaeria nubilosa]|uniref:Uncharacterized protein n=1 Tax=Teratosphaeria nubilosa TaxID=161662 RepID=A0A6G1L637_9PEZI|nr:hypothetical protein EJ03DRAFT_118609 [Teratosphaeria nubilosa]